MAVPMPLLSLESLVDALSEDGADCQNDVEPEEGSRRGTLVEGPTIRCVAMPWRKGSRREFLAATAAGIAALAAPRIASARHTPPPGTQYFVSAPQLRPPALTVNTRTTGSTGLLFVASLNGPGQRGPLILDDRGRAVWFHPVNSVAFNFRRQLYRGEPVLTWWEGAISDGGVGEGEGVIVDATYTEIARVRAGNGLKADEHELLLTPRGTALITALESVPADLTAVNGAPSSNTLDSIVQEIDVSTGRVLFEWRSLDHVPVTDSYAGIVDPYDYFHVNSIDVDVDGNLLVSGRNTATIYKVDRTSGKVLWRLGGKSSDFTMGSGARFMFQHDARGHTDGTLTLFDDGPGPSSQQARALRLGLDFAGMEAILLQEYTHPVPLDVAEMGNAQFLADDSVVVGWGNQPYITEFGPGGDVRFDAKFDGSAWNYRAFRDVWVGRPKSLPAVVVERHAGEVLVHVSWNGSTETAYWRIEADDLLKTVAATGFETVISVPGRPRLVAVTPLDARHRPLTQRATTARA
jgi:hypothetical protein